MNRVPQPFERLLKHLHRGGTFGFWCYESAARRQDNPDRPAERRSIWWPCNDPSGLPNIEGPKGLRHVWYGVHPCHQIPETSGSGKALPAQYLRSQVRYINAINCLYAEYDAKDFGGKEEAGKHITSLALQPSVIIDSGGGYHCYWLLRDTWVINDDNRAEATTVQHAWVACVGGDGGAKNINRVLRVPGSINCKKAYAPDYPTVRFIRNEMQKLYTLDELRGAIPTEALERAEQGNHKPADLDDYARAGALVNMLCTSRRENYQDWLAVGQSLAGLGGAGLAIWDGWSRGGSTYKAGECDKKWKGFGESGITFASLVHWARTDSPGEFERLYGAKARHNIRGTGMLQPAKVGAQPEEINPKLLCKDASDEGNAQAVHLLYGNQFLFCEAYGWLYWCGTHWDRAMAEGKLERAIIEALKLRRKAAVDLGNEAIIKESKPDAKKVRAAKFMFRSMVEVGVDEFDADPDLLNCQNGTIHLPTGELRKHDPADMLTYSIKIGLRIDADDSHWLEFLRGTVAGEGDLAEEIVTYLQTCAGYSLTGHTSEEVLWYIHGPTRSGKGTFTETLYEILGAPLATEVDFTTFTKDRDNDSNNFDLAPLKPARLVFASESERHQRMKGAKLKALTGGNQIRCCFKNKDHFTYRPQYKIWLTSNHPPNADVDDDAVWGRLRVLVFPNSHLGNEDKTLKQKMRERASLEGVLAWAVRGAKRWYEQRGTGLETPEYVKEETTKARVELDTVGQWIEECIELRDDKSPDYYITNSDLYQGYANWCDDNGVPPKQKAGLTRSLNAKGIEGPKVKKVMGKSKRVWLAMEWS